MRMMWFGGGALSLVFGFLTSFYVTFPIMIRDRINAEVHKATSGAQSVMIDSIRPSWMGGHSRGLF